MKIFDAQDKAIVRKITQGSGFSRSLINVLDSQNTLHGVRIRIDRSDKSAQFLFESQNQDPGQEEISLAIGRQKEITELLIRHVILLRYLEKEELAVFFEPTRNPEQIIEFGMGAVNKPSFSMSMSDCNLIDLLIKYIDKEILPSPSLRSLEKNDFISGEERRFNLEYRATLTAIGVSMCLGLYGIYIAE